MAATTFRTSMSSNLGSIKIGTDFNKLLAKAKPVGNATVSGNYRDTAVDLNGDGQADAFERETLDPATLAVTGRSLSETVNGVDFDIEDSNADGKVDTFSRIDGKGVGYAVFDQNHDGKADLQVTYAKTQNRELIDSDLDGKADQWSLSRKATSKDVFAPAPAPALGLSIGGAAFATLPKGAKQILRQDTPTTHTLGWDLNGDFLADVTKTQTLDAAKNVVSTSITYNLPAGADGTPGASGTATDNNGDGKIDSLWLPGTTSSRYLVDSNNDGKLDQDFTYGADGSGQGLQDNDADGKADWVTQWGKL